MSGRWVDLMCSVDLQPTLVKVQGEQVLDFAEYSLLRESAEAKLYQLMGTVRRREGTAEGAQFDGEQELRHLQEASVRMAHLLQSSCLALRRLNLEYNDQRLAREALEHQLAYIQACLQRSMNSFS